MTPRCFKVRSTVVAGTLAGFALFLSAGANAAPITPEHRSIGYAIMGAKWATYETADAKECPEGFNDGPREQFKALYPEDGARRTEVETRLSREIDAWFPTAQADAFPFHEAKSTVAYGMNLDGKVGPHDFVSPEGEAGIDNQLYRAVGCIRSYRGEDGYSNFYPNKHMGDDRYNRILIEITNVDSLANDDDVDVTMYRGLDRLLTDATGLKIMPGGSQRIDVRWGKKYIQHMKGKIVDGVLVTAPTDITFPWSTFGVPTDEIMRGARFRLKLTSDGAEGMMAGYSDIDSWYFELTRSESTHHRSYGQLSAPSLYRAMRRLADGYPDAKTGANTAISSALLTRFTQVFIVHKDGDSIAENEAVPRKVTIRTVDRSPTATAGR